ncbi:MAG: polyprenyl synthetase family protein [candidate division WOR-3 bacterium]|nr:MAG: polyprenyl synthetase family protein [candidate division WOR-3 bacterium]
MTETIPSILAPLKHDITEVNRILSGTYTGGTGYMEKIFREVLGEGKRIRAGLVILVARMFKRPLKEFYGLAGAVELLHAASLIHDDVVDGSGIRRGYESTHAKWSVEIAVLAGDFLFAEAVRMIADLRKPQLLGMATGAISAICAGEIEELMGEHAFMSRDEYFRNIEAKTATLFGTAVQMSGLLARAECQQIERLKEFGYAFGIAFQIMDDVLDLVGDERHTGKPVGSDLASGVVTLPVILYLENGGASSYLDAVLNGERTPEHIRHAIDDIRSSCAIRAAIAEARGYTNRAMEALAGLPECRECQILYNLAGCIIDPCN